MPGVGHRQPSHAGKDEFPRRWSGLSSMLDDDLRQFAEHGRQISRSRRTSVASIPEHGEPQMESAVVVPEAQTVAPLSSGVLASLVAEGTVHSQMHPEWTEPLTIPLSEPSLPTVDSGGVSAGAITFGNIPGIEGEHSLRAPCEETCHADSYEDAHALASGKQHAARVVCRHWKIKGLCRLGDECKFSHPAHKQGSNSRRRAVQSAGSGHSVAASADNAETSMAFGIK